jgi:hypothetical protein
MCVYVPLYLVIKVCTLILLFVFQIVCSFPRIYLDKQETLCHASMPLNVEVDVKFCQNARIQLFDRFETLNNTSMSLIGVHNGRMDGY